jgi:hypothetical protein
MCIEYNIVFNSWKIKKNNHCHSYKIFVSFFPKEKEYPWHPLAAMYSRFHKPELDCSFFSQSFKFEQEFGFEADGLIYSFFLIYATFSSSKKPVYKKILK